MSVERGDEGQRLMVFVLTFILTQCRTVTHTLIVIGLAAMLLELRYIT